MKIHFNADYFRQPLGNLRPVFLENVRCWTQRMEFSYLMGEKKIAEVYADRFRAAERIVYSVTHTLVRSSSEMLCQAWGRSLDGLS